MILKSPFREAQAALVVKKLPVNTGDMRVSVSIPEGERSLEEDMAAHSSILAWRIPWTEEPGGLQSTGSQESDTPEVMLSHDSACTH